MMSCRSTTLDACNERPRKLPDRGWHSWMSETRHPAHDIHPQGSATIEIFQSSYAQRSNVHRFLPITTYPSSKVAVGSNVQLGRVAFCQRESWRSSAAAMRHSNDRNLRVHNLGIGTRQQGIDVTEMTKALGAKQSIRINKVRVLVSVDYTAALDRAQESPDRILIRRIGCTVPSFAWTLLNHRVAK